MHTSSLELITPFGVTEFISGRLGFGRSHAGDFNISTFDEEYSFQGGRLLLGQGVVTYSDHSLLARVGIWEGKERSVAAHLYEHQSLDMIAMFDFLTLVEEPGGVVAVPKNAKVTPIVMAARHAPEIILHLHDLGLVRCYEGTTDAKAFLPPWGGSDAAGGELLAGDGGTYIIISDSAVAHVYTDGEEASDSVIADHLFELVVEWQSSNGSTTQ
jgi:hypothetical protein